MQEPPRCPPCPTEPSVHQLLLRELPAEIKLEIFRHALICSDHLAFCPLSLTQKEKEAEANGYPQAFYRRQRFSSSLRLARWNQCQFDEPVAKQLFETFSVLSLVSKGTRNTTRKIFFGENKWVLHVTRAMNAIDWIAKHWGTEVMGMMREVRIEVQALQKPCSDALETFVEAVNKGGILKSLQVQWLEASPSLQVAMKPARGPEGSWHFHPMCRCYGIERNSEGGRGLVLVPGVEEHDEIDELDVTKYTGPGFEPEEWKTDEQVLAPLKKLRGASKVRIEGTVTEKWAKELEEIMAST
ncbi:hypothetical protein BDZ45DRAFT_81152 [Acephala macrosclerotiorum]|nr:hypothetical protein BDZ45DRAFT_81152 [Acephala macrosclerotiorum]